MAQPWPQQWRSSWDAAPPPPPAGESRKVRPSLGFPGLSCRETARALETARSALLTSQSCLGCRHVNMNNSMEKHSARNRNDRIKPLTAKKLQSGVIYHPVLGYPIPPPVPVAVARRNARERSRVKTVNDSYQHLKNHVPGAARQKRMSKVDIIKHSIDYIQRLRRSLQDSELPASDEANHPGDLEERLTPCSGDSGYQSQSQSQSHSQSPHYNYYKHSPSSTSSSSFSSLPGAAHQPSPGLQTDCDVLDAIMEWQDDCESWLSLFLLRNKLISTLLSLSL